jgi:eukaryotic-like serine/threonine-protein kinase
LHRNENHHPVLELPDGPFTMSCVRGQPGFAATNLMAKERSRRIGKYEVVKHIATGGMGAVYRAVDTELDRPVALKVLNPEIAAKQNMLDRFKREARAAARLRHENIVAIYDVGEIAGTHYLALEFVDGVDLHEYICKKGKLPPEEARQIVIQAARALEHAHKQGIVHRDIKPANFLIAKQNERLLVKMTDLGLARTKSESMEEEYRLTRDGTTVGTIDYMSPEQSRSSSAADIRSDIYSLGCTFYHMLAGRGLFCEGSLPERITKHAEVEPPDIRDVNAAVPEGLVVILGKMLAKKPADRYQTPAELLEDLENPDKLKLHVSQGDALAKLADLAQDEGPVEAIGSRARKMPRPAPSRKKKKKEEEVEEPSSWASWLPLAIALGAILVAGIIILVQLQIR